MSRQSEHPSGWWARRRERKRIERERTGDTPEKTAERARNPDGGDSESVAESAQRASTGLVAGGASYQG